MHFKPQHGIGVQATNEPQSPIRMLYHYVEPELLSVVAGVPSRIVVECGLLENRGGDLELGGRQPGGEK